VTQRRPQVLIEGTKGRLLIRAWGKGWRVKATAFDGDVTTELLMAGHAAKLLQEVTRSITGEPELQFVSRGIRHIEDHG
jgi:hypothetical protein